MLTFRQQERSGIEEVQDTRSVDTILVYEKLLSLAKGRVDNLRDPFGVLRFRDSQFNRLVQARLMTPRPASVETGVRPAILQFYWCGEQILIALYDRSRIAELQA